MEIRRNMLPIIEQSLDEYSVTLITGARQVGKTTLALLFRSRGFSSLTFDDTDLLAEAKKNPKEFIASHPAPIIFDEIQKAKELFPEIENVVNAVKREKGTSASNGLYILTGSQKFQLMKGVSESMSGRVSIIELPPLSMAEILGYEQPRFRVDNDVLMDRAERRALDDEQFYEAIVRGFYPARWETPGKKIHNFFSNYMKTYLERDVSALINLRDQVKFENLMKVLASLTGEEFIPDNVAKIIGVDKNTVLAWTSIMITGDIITLLPPYYEESIAKRVVKRSKLYFCDTGLACYLLGIDTPAALKRSVFRGRIVETYIHNEIRKSILNSGEEANNMFYYRDNNQNEIDLILVRDGRIDRVECKSGKKYDFKDIKGFSKIEGTNYDFGGSCILCLCDEPYRIAPNVFAYPIRVI